MHTVRMLRTLTGMFPHVELRGDVEWGDPISVVSGSTGEPAGSLPQFLLGRLGIGRFVRVLDVGCRLAIKDAGHQDRERDLLGLESLIRLQDVIGTVHNISGHDLTSAKL